MRYVTRRATPSEYVALTDVEDAIIKCLDLEYVTCNNSGSTEDSRLLYYLKNDVDFSVVNPSYIASYDLVELSAETAVQFVSAIHSEQNVSLDEDGLFVVTSKNNSNIVVDFTDKSRRPYRNAVWDDERRLWVMPIEKLNDFYFSSTWNNSAEKWVSECNVHPDQSLRIFYVWNAGEVKRDSLYSTACSSTNFSIESVEKITHGVDSISSLVVEVSEDGKGNKYPKIQKHFVPIDLAPVALLTYQECAEEDKHIFAGAMKIHPQCGARNIDELFRLIVEWAWSYTELGNEEPMAKLCHDILRVVQMPLEVRNDLLNLKPQPVARFILGDTDALLERDDPDPMPESFRLWISDIYYKYRTRTVDAPLNVNVDSIAESYPM